MPARVAVKLTMRSVDALSTGARDAMFRDRDLPGFGVRVYRTGRKVYIVQARGPKGSRRAVVGRHGDVDVRGARRKAVVMIDRIKRGLDPAPAPPAREPAVADLAERYMAAHVEVSGPCGTRAPRSRADRGPGTSRRAPRSTARPRSAW